MGYATLESGGEDVRLISSGVLVLSTDDPNLRLMEIHEFVVDRILDSRVDAVAIERTISGGFIGTSELVSAAVGVIRLACAECGVPCHAITTSSMARTFTGSGSRSGKKSRTKRRAKELFWPEFATYSRISEEVGGDFEHVADACGIAYSALKGG